MGENIAGWSTAPASNATVGSIDWAEGMAPAQVNNSARQEMADVADWHHNQAEWINRGETPVFVAATQFKIAGVNVSGVYSVGRRVELVATTPGTIYGTITAVAFSTDTTVTIDWDTATELSNEALTRVSVGIIQNSASTASLVGIPIGGFIDYGSTAAEPAGWKFCDGQILNRTTFADLFSVIGTTYGSSDASTFKTPDARGRVTVGLDDMGGSSANRITSTSADTMGGVLGQESTSQSVSLTGSVSGTSITEANLPSSVTLSDTGCGDGGDGVSGATFLAGVSAGTHARNITIALGSGSAHTHSDTFAVSSTDTVSVIQPSLFGIKIIRAF